MMRRILISTPPSLSLLHALSLSPPPAKTLVARLANGPPDGMSGRLEVNYNGQGWGTVCPNGWTISNADVACRMVGFNSAASLTSGSLYGAGLGRIWFDNVNCNGQESNLLNCTSFNGPLVSTTPTCDHSRDIGVSCSCELYWGGRGGGGRGRGVACWVR